MPDAIVPISYAHALILGFVQGLTELLPVSSTAHMRILPALLHWPDPGAAFSAVVQLGPIAALLSIFWGQIVRYLTGIGRSIKARTLFPAGDTDARLGWYTILGTIPLIVSGLALEKYIDTNFRQITVVAVALIVLAIVLLIAERTAQHVKPLEQMTLGNALAIGLSQAIAVIPGTSRSGLTITTGLFAGLTREAAVDFSFLLSIPAITLAGLYKLAKVLHGSHLGGVAGPYLASAVVAGIVAYAAVRWLLKYIGKEGNTTMPFIIYRIALGIVLLILVHTGYLASVTPATAP